MPRALLAAPTHPPTHPPDVSSYRCFLFFASQDYWRSQTNPPNHRALIVYVTQQLPSPDLPIVFLPPLRLLRLPWLPPFLCSSIQAVFNILILVIVWPWVYIAYRRVLTNLRAKYRGQEVRRYLKKSVCKYLTFLLLLLLLLLLAAAACCCCLLLLLAAAAACWLAADRLILLLSVLLFLVFCRVASLLPWSVGARFGH